MDIVCKLKATYESKNIISHTPTHMADLATQTHGSYLTCALLSQVESKKFR